MALAIVASMSSAGAASLDIKDWYGKVRDAAQSLLGERQPDREVIAAPKDIDQQMALMPPHHGRMRVIVPPGSR